MDYAFDFKGHGVYTPDGKIDIPSSKVDVSNRAKEQQEIKWLKTGPDRVFLYVHEYTNEERQNGPVYGRWCIRTWLGTIVSDLPYIGPRCQIGFGMHTYRRAVSCRIFGTLYHGWYMESSGDYCRLRKAKRQ